MIGLPYVRVCNSGTEFLCCKTPLTDFAMPAEQGMAEVEIEVGQGVKLGSEG